MGGLGLQWDPSLVPSAGGALRRALCLVLGSALGFRAVTRKPLPQPAGRPEVVDPWTRINGAGGTWRRQRAPQAAWLWCRVAGSWGDGAPPRGHTVCGPVVSQSELQQGRGSGRLISVGLLGFFFFLQLLP